MTYNASLNNFFSQKTSITRSCDFLRFFRRPPLAFLAKRTADRECRPRISILFEFGYYISLAHNFVRFFSATSVYFESRRSVVPGNDSGDCEM